MKGKTVRTEMDGGPMGDGMMGDGMMGGMMGMMWPWMILSVVVLVVVLVVLVYLVIFLVRVERRRSSEALIAAHGAAQNLLDDRFARGDIAEDEYRARREALRQN